MEINNLHLVHKGDFSSVSCFGCGIRIRELITRRVIVGVNNDIVISNNYCNKWSTLFSAVLPLT